MTGVLIDCGNLRAGGALQVASAMLSDLGDPAIVRDYPWLKSAAELRVSPAVVRNLTMDVSALPLPVRIEEIPRNPMALFRRSKPRFDVRFTLFGPTYSGRIARREITGFAEVMLVYEPTDYGRTSCRTPREVIGTALKRRLVSRSDIFVTETAALKDRIAARFGIPLDRILVVPNRPHPLYQNTPLFDAPPPRGETGELHVAFPTRAYPHKNLDIVGRAGAAYADRTGGRLVVHVTLRDAEWQQLAPETRRWMINAGELTPPQVLALYRSVDAIFFPSLLEASSATPLEANILGIPLIASDRDFVKTSARAFATFDPLSGDDAARALARTEAEKDVAWAEARQIAIAYRRELSATSRTRSYLDLIAREFHRGGPDLADIAGAQIPI